MKRINRTIAGVITAYAACMSVFASDARANGLIISPVAVNEEAGPHSRGRRPIHQWLPFEIRHQQIDVSISEVMADTTVEQTFLNRTGVPQEGHYLFPIAENAGVQKFTMWMNGREVTGELLDADKARQIYESIVARSRDPGLLQFAGRGLIQAKVFPIPPGGECRIRIRYSEPVRVDGGLASYRFPLGEAGCRFQPIERLSLRAAIRTDRPLISAFSSSHECSIDRRSEREIVMAFEKQRHAPEADFQLFAQLGDDAFGLSLIPYRIGEDDGYFMARIAPRVSGKDDAVLPKNICFVLDTSGSMADDNKIAQARKALQFCITNLNRQDRFNVISFATETRPFRNEWTVADDAGKTAAREFVESLNAVGGTDINAALLKALEMRPAPSDTTDRDAWQNHPYFVVFITDGEPTVGVTQPDEIIRNATRANTGGRARIFSLGVGHQLNTRLLDRLSDDNGGARDYVTPSENLEIKISAFYTKLANPVLSDVSLSVEGVSIHDTYPRQLPDMFAGSELVVVGRYGAAKGPQQITLTGNCRGERRSFTYACNFPVRDAQHEFLPRFWAMRKIGFLLDELRLHGETTELKNEVIRLAKQYGVLTPFTSYLVQEDEQMAQREGRAPASGGFMPAPVGGALRRRGADNEEAAAGQRASVGASATRQSQSNLKMRKMEAADTRETLDEVQLAYRDETGNQLINYVGANTYYFAGDRWVDSKYDGKSPTRKIVLYSPEYFELLKSHANLGPALAQGERVVVAMGKEFIETVPAGTPDGKESTRN